MRTESACLAVVVACGLSFAACSQTSPPGDDAGGTSGSGGVGPGSGGSSAAKGGTGGSTGGTLGAGGGTGATGGSAGTGSPGSCTNVTACGGDVVKTWNASASCLTVSGQLDLPTAGLDPRSCTSAPITGTLNVTGSITLNADKTYTDNTTTTGSCHVDLAAGCLQISGTQINCKGAEVALEAAGWTTATCTDAPGGGCSCNGMTNQTGGLGVPTPIPATSGNYLAANNVLTLTTDSGNETESYCASGSTLTITPQSTTATVITGTITLSAPGSSGGAGGMGSGGGAGMGTGGAGATGGAGGSAGMGTGGANPMGGMGGTGAGQGGSAGAAAGTSNSGGSGGMINTGRADGPCDVYAAANTPCVAAYSMVRALSKTYTGALFQVRSGSSSKNTGTGGMTKDILMLADGYADTASVDAFCMGTTCTVSLLYDQSGNGNHLPVAKKGNTAGGATGGEDDYESSATKGAVTAGGHKVYPLYMAAHEGYRLQKVGKNMPLKTAAQGIYEVADGTHAGTACCWDFGNVTTDPTAYGVMNTLFFGKAFWGNGAGSGPWMMADFEAGVWAGGSKVGDPGWGGLSDSHPSNPNNPSLAVAFAMGILKTQSSKWGLRMADVKTASDLTTAYEGALPKAMDNLGGIVLGVGGDNSNNSWGTFYEGAIVSGYPDNATDLKVMQNVKAVGYTK